jgi:hypothetical protein
MVGSGAWACAAIHMLAQNCRDDDPAIEFVKEVKMWVYEENFEVSLICRCIWQLAAFANMVHRAS